MTINKAKFFKEYREVFGSIKKDQTVKSIETIIDVFESGGEKIKPLEKLAYALATVYHEVGSDMLPITENLNYTSAKRIMQVWPSRFPTMASAQKYVKNPRELGNKVYGLRLGNGLLEGFKYRGRGIGGQITGYVNYKKFSEILGVDLVRDPDLANDLVIGAKILYLGLMTKQACKGDKELEGLGIDMSGDVCVMSSFTGKTLSDFINSEKTDYVNARSAVNADVSRNGAKIAEVAKKFERILKNSLL